MEENFINHINAIIAVPAPRTALLWRRWADQSGIAITDRAGIINDFSAYVHQQLGDTEIAAATISNLSAALQDFWSLADACAVVPGKN